MSHAHAAAPDLSGLPAGARVEPVLEDGVVDGQRASILRIRHDGPPGPLLQWLTGEGVSRAATIRTRSGPWEIASVREGEGYRTLQWRVLPGGGIEALQTHWRGPAAPRGAAFDPASALPAGARVLRRVSAVDGGRRNETLVASTDDPVESTAAAIHQRLLAAGFQAGPVRGAPRSGLTRQYRAKDREVALTVTPHPGRSGLVLHHSEVSP